MNGAFRFLLRPRVMLSAAAGVVTALGVWLFWPVGPRAVLPAILRCEAAYFSPDSKSVVTMHWQQGNEGAVVLWDVATGQERHRLFEGSPYFKHIAFSPDGRKVAGRDSGSAYKAQVHIWDLDSGQKEAVLWRNEWRDWGCTPIAFSPAGKVLVFDPYRDVMVDAETGGEAIDLKRRHGITWCFRTTGMDEHVLFSDLKTVWIVHLGTGALCAAFNREDLTEDLSGQAITPDGKIMVAGLARVSRPHFLFNAHTGERRRVPLADGGSWLALSPDGRWLAAGGPILHDYGGWRRWLPEWARPKHASAFDVFDLDWGWYVGHFPGVSAAKFSPDGRTLALIAEDETVQLWDFPFRTPWAIITTGGLVAAAIVYLLLALGRRAQGK
jgi:WD40 repeat protein